MSTDEDKADLESILLKDLVNIGKTKLRQVLLRAYKSSLYRERWRTAGVHPDQVHSLEDLCLLPFVTRKELFEATRTKRGRITCSPIDAWFTGSNTSEWFPFSAKDFLGIVPMLARMRQATGLQRGDIVLAVTDTPPRIWSLIPFLWTCSEASRSPRLEFITVSLDWYDTLGMTWIDFIQRRRPTVLFTSTKNALTLADKIHKDLKVPAREVLTETRIGIFYGDPLEDSKTKILDTYTIEPYEIYSSIEHMSFCIECGAHQGIHLWMDACIPEIIPTGSEGAVPLWEASPGTTGELVITNFAESLPLIRYKTDESICVEGTDSCTCGRTHPRISRLPKAHSTSTPTAY